jgi:hypothetical protein
VGWTFHHRHVETFQHVSIHCFCHKIHKIKLTQICLPFSFYFSPFSLSISISLLAILTRVTGCMNNFFLKLLTKILKGTLIEAAKSGSVSRFIGRSRSEDSVCNSPPPNSSNHHHLHLHRNESASNSPNSDEAVTESPTDSNPSLDKPEGDQHHGTSKHHHRHTSHSQGSSIQSNDQHQLSPPNEQTQSHSNQRSSSHSSNNSNSNKKDHHHHLHMPHVNLNFSALAALKRKRKKFSNSRNESPIIEPPSDVDSATTALPSASTSSSSVKKSLKKVIIPNQLK